MDMMDMMDADHMLITLVTSWRDLVGTIHGSSPEGALSRNVAGRLLTQGHRSRRWPRLKGPLVDSSFVHLTSFNLHEDGTQSKDACSCFASGGMGMCYVLRAELALNLSTCLGLSVSE